MSELKDRLRMVAEGMYNISVNSFEKKCGLPATTINKMGEGLYSGNLTLIANACPELNVRWLLTGQGEMAVQNPQQCSEKDRKIIELEKEIDVLKGKLEVSKEYLEMAYKEFRQQSQPINQTVIR